MIRVRQLGTNIEAKKTRCYGQVAPLQKSRPFSEIESVLLADLVACCCHHACEVLMFWCLSVAFTPLHLPVMWAGSQLPADLAMEKRMQKVAPAAKL